MSHQDRMDRRCFSGQLVAGFGLSAALSTTQVSGSDPVPPAPKLPIDPEEERREPPPELLLLSYLIRAYPSDHFDEQAMQGIFRDIRGDVARGRVLAEFPLKNSDEPAFVFEAYRQPDDL